MRRETLHFVAAERVLDRVDQAFVAVGAGLHRLRRTRGKGLHQVVVRDEGPGDGDAVAQSIGQRLLDDGRGLESAGAQHRNAHRLLDPVRIGQVHPLDVPEIASGLFPSPLEERAGEAALEEQIIATGQQSARDERVVGLAQLLDGQGACRVAGVREEAAARHVDRVDAFRLEQPADLDGVLERIPFRLVVEECIVVLDRADLHLQVKITSDFGANRADDLEHEARAVLELAPVLVLAVVDPRAEELRDEIAVRPVQLDAVRAGIARASRAPGERGRDLLESARRSSARTRNRAAGRHRRSSSAPWRTRCRERRADDRRG